MVRLDPAVLIQCAACRSWVYLPRPTAAEQATRHDLPAYFDHPYFSNRRGADVVAQRRCQKAFASIGSVISLDNLAGERLLDVGCDTGAFLSAAVEQVGVVPLGVDVSSRAVREAQQNGIEAYHADLQTAPATVRDLAVITAIDLIEHVRSGRIPGGSAIAAAPWRGALSRNAEYLVGRIPDGSHRKPTHRHAPEVGVRPTFSARAHCVFQPR